MDVNKAKELLNDAFKATAVLSVSGEAVDLVAYIRECLRKAYAYLTEENTDSEEKGCDK